MSTWSLDTSETVPPHSSVQQPSEAQIAAFNDLFATLCTRLESGIPAGKSRLFTSLRNQQTRLIPGAGRCFSISQAKQVTITVGYISL